MWIKTTDVVRETPTGRYDRAGDEMVDLKLDPDADVLVELALRTTAQKAAGSFPVADWPEKHSTHLASCTEVCISHWWGLFPDCYTICPVPPRRMGPPQ